MNRHLWQTSDEPAYPNMDQASVARVYDWLLGGKDNYRPDRDFGRKILEENRHLKRLVRDNRAFLGRAVRYLTQEAGIRQFIDIGTGLPTQNNVHDIAQRYAPESRVAYVDNDPLVAVHARALLASTSPRLTLYIHADAHESVTILGKASAAGLDLSQPIALLFVAVLHFFEDADAVVAPFLDAAAPGSHLVISHGLSRPEMASVAAAYQDQLGVGTLRTTEQITALFGGWELVPPGVTPLPDWRPAVGEPATDRAAAELGLGGVARKPARVVEKGCVR
ncbi:SAM-dependent methyltransferase [Actinomadura litoris]|nr:SAM-dependent methyltransferase [Actinomadura litoris]